MPRLPVTTTDAFIGYLYTAPLADVLEAKKRVCAIVAQRKRLARKANGSDVIRAHTVDIATAIRNITS